MFPFGLLLPFRALLPLLGGGVLLFGSVCLHLLRAGIWRLLLLPGLCFVRLFRPVPTLFAVRFAQQLLKAPTLPRQFALAQQIIELPLYHPGVKGAAVLPGAAALLLLPVLCFHLRHFALPLLFATSDTSGAPLHTSPRPPPPRR